MYRSGSAMLPRTLASASLRQTSWLRFQTVVQRSESSGRRNSEVVIMAGGSYGNGRRARRSSRLVELIGTKRADRERRALLYTLDSRGGASYLAFHLPFGISN